MCFGKFATLTKLSGVIFPNAQQLDHQNDHKNLEHRAPIGQYDQKSKIYKGRSNLLD